MNISNQSYLRRVIRYVASYLSNIIQKTFGRIRHFCLKWIRPLKLLIVKQLMGLQCFGSVFGQETSFVGQYHDFTLSFNVNSMLPLCGFEVLGFTSPNSVYVGECLHGVCPIHQ